MERWSNGVMEFRARRLHRGGAEGPEYCFERVAARRGPAALTR